jgi:hypothetical protein
MLAFEFSCGLGHGSLIKSPRIVQRPAVLKRRQHAPAIDPVAVGFSLCLPARVKFRTHFFGGNHPDCRRQQRVQGALKFRCRQRGLRLEMGHLPKCVNPGIGAACALDQYLLLGDLAGRVDERALNRSNAGLQLPAMKFRPVVCNGELDVAHFR